MPRVKVPLEKRLEVYSVLRRFGVANREALGIARVGSAKLSEYRRQNPEFNEELYVNEVRRRLRRLFFKLGPEKYAELEKAVFRELKFGEPKPTPLSPEGRKRLIELIKELRGGHGEEEG